MILLQLAKVVQAQLHSAELVHMTHLQNIYIYTPENPFNNKLTNKTLLL